MVAVADTGFIVSLYLAESTSAAAEAALIAKPTALSATPLTMLELRNAFNRAVQRQRITVAERDALWADVESDVSSGVLVPSVIPLEKLFAVARQLSDRYTPTEGTRSLDLLHVAAALILEASVFFTFDGRQRKAAAGEGLDVRP